MFIFTLQGMPLCVASQKGPMPIAVNNKEKAEEMAADLRFVLGEGVGLQYINTKPVEQENDNLNFPGFGKTLENMTHNPEFDV